MSVTDLNHKVTVHQVLGGLQCYQELFCHAMNINAMYDACKTAEMED